MNKTADTIETETTKVLETFVVFKLSTYFELIAFLCVFLLFSMPIDALGNNSLATTPTMRSMEIIANQVAKKLYETIGNKAHPMPSVRLIECKEVGKCTGARYRKLTNTIELETQLYQVCRSFGRDSLSALAFVLGHELGHYYEDLDIEPLGLLQQQSASDARTDKEHRADIHGIFNAYIAGYDTRRIVPRVLDAIYDAYALKGKPLYGYPSLTERQYTTQEVLEKVDELIHVFDVANYLTAIEAYEEAAAAYEYVLNYYQGREIYNNLGVCYTLQALNFTKIDYDLYLFPLELDLDTRLKKDKSDTGIDAINREEIRKRNELLDRAMQLFQYVSKLDRSYLIDDLNIICIHILKQEYQQALQYFQASALEKKARFQRSPALVQSKIQLAKALALAHVWDKQQAAITLWQKLSNDANAAIAFQANYNLSVIQGKNAPNCDGAYACYEPTNTNLIIDNFHFSRQPTSGIALSNYSSYQLFYQRQPNSIIYALTKPNGQQLIIQRVHQGSFKNRQRIRVPDLRFNSVNTLLADGYFFTTCEQKQTAFLGTEENRLLEWVKYKWR